MNWILTGTACVWRAASRGAYGAYFDWADKQNGPNPLAEVGLTNCVDQPLRLGYTVTCFVVALLALGVFLAVAPELDGGVACMLALGVGFLVFMAPLLYQYAAPVLITVAIIAVIVGWIWGCYSWGQRRKRRPAEAKA